ncbi:MAG: iron-sulfur cluster assembly accessory protein [Gammaproteobacteria bacterium]|nr:iron-sulfur cluster assembly accessory protein [Gammaproteobacteria bacterium]
MNQKVSSLVLTDAAKHKINALIKKENKPNLKLRIFVVGGGCAGLRYGFVFDEKIKEEDTVFENTLLIDWVSITYLRTATIDYKDDRFSIHNPSVRTGCPGCGLRV